MSRDHITYPLTSYPPKCVFAVTCFLMWHVANWFLKWFCIIKQLLPLSEGDMTIYSHLTGYDALRLRPQAILPASGEQIVMSPSLKGNNC